MMRNKYGNRKINHAGEVFDSKREFERFRELELRVRAGVIHDLHRQVRFELIPAQYEGKNQVERAVHYVADFVYWEGDQMVVEDVKSKATRTESYIIKRKLMRQKGYIIREVE